MLISHPHLCSLHTAGILSLGWEPLHTPSLCSECFGKGQPPLLPTSHRREAATAPLPGFQAQLFADLMIFIFFFPSSFLCRSLLSVPVGWKQHGGEPCRELHMPEEHLLASPCLPFPLCTCSPRSRRCFPPEDVVEGPGCPSAKCQMVHSHQMRDMARRHAAALARGWSALGTRLAAWGSSGAARAQAADRNEGKG